MFKLMASQSSSNVFSKTDFKLLTPSMDQVGLYEDWKVHAHPGVPSQKKDSCSK